MRIAHPCIERRLDHVELKLCEHRLPCLIGIHSVCLTIRMRRANPPFSARLERTGYERFDQRTSQELRALDNVEFLSQRRCHSSREVPRETTLFAYDKLKRCPFLRSVNVKESGGERTCPAVHCRTCVSAKGMGRLPHGPHR